MSDGLVSRAWRTVIGGAAAAVGGTAEWLARVTPGVSMTASVQSAPVKPEVTAGVAMMPTDAVLKVAQSPGVSVVTHVDSTAVKPQVTSGVAMSVVEQTTAFTQSPAFEIVRITDDLTHRKGATTVTSGGTGAWSTPTNAQADHNGTLSSHTGNLTAAHNTDLTFVYSDLVDKTALTIVSVKLHFYVKQAGTVLNDGGLHLYRGDAASQQAGLLESITGDVDSLTTPRTFDVTSSYTTWASLNDLRASVRHQTAVGKILITADCDAVELEITASLTWTV